MPMIVDNEPTPIGGGGGVVSVTPGGGGGGPVVSVNMPKKLTITWGHTDATPTLVRGFRIVAYTGTDPNDVTKYLFIPKEVGPTINSLQMSLITDAPLSIRVAVQALYKNGNEGSWRDSGGDIVVDPDTTGIPTSVDLDAKSTVFFEPDLRPVSPLALRANDMWIDSTPGHGNKLYTATAAGNNWTLTQDSAAAQEEVDNVQDDGILSRAEKPGMKSRYDAAVLAKNAVVGRAKALGVPYDAVVSAFTALTDLLESLPPNATEWYNAATNTTLPNSTILGACWAAYDAEMTKLILVCQAARGGVDFVVWTGSTPATVNLSSPPTTIDGVALATNNKILLTNQPAPAENGLYKADVSGAVAAVNYTPATSAKTSSTGTYVNNGNDRDANAGTSTTADSAAANVSIEYYDFSGSGTVGRLHAFFGVVVDGSTDGLDGSATASYSLNGGSTWTQFPSGNITVNDANVHVFADLTGVVLSQLRIKVVGSGGRIKEWIDGAWSIKTYQTNLTLKAFYLEGSASSSTVIFTKIADVEVGEAYDVRSGTKAAQAAQVTAKTTGGALTLSYAGASAVTAAWGSISGTLSAQTDLQTALNGKINKAGDTGIGALTIASSSGITFDSGAGYSSYVRPNNLGFNRAGSSYITQDGIGGNIVVKTSNVAQQDTTAFTINANGSVSFMSSISAGAGTFNSTLTAPNMDVNAAAGVTRDLRFNTNGVIRWGWRVQDAESTGDAGANIYLMARTDAGGLIDYPMTVVRAANGAITFAATRPVSMGALSVGTISQAKTAKIVNAGNGAQLMEGLFSGIAEAYSSCALVMGMNIKVDPADAVNSQVRVKQTHATIGYGFWKVAGNQTSFYGASGSVVAGDIITPTEQFRIVNSGAVSYVPFTANAGLTVASGYAKIQSTPGVYGVMFSTDANVTQWLMNANGALTGSNAGNDWTLSRYSDAGAWLGNALVISRATGNATIAGTLNASLVNAPNGFYTQNIAFLSNRLDEVATNGVAEIAINWKGYAGGTTQFRNFSVYDGKSNLVMQTVGSTKATTFGGTVTAPQFIGPLWDTGTGSTWLSQRDDTSVAVRGNVGTGSYRAYVQSRSNDWTFTLGSLGNSSFGIFGYLNTRSTNGTDISAYLSSGGDWVVTRDGQFNGAVYSGGLIRSNGAVSVNLHLDPTAGANATYINYFQGTDGVKFGNGANGVVASINSAGALTATQGTFVANDAYITVRGGGGAQGLILESGPDKSGYLWQFENAPLFFATNNTIRLTLASDGTATFAKNLQATQQRLGLGTYNGNDGDSFTTRALKGCHFGRIQGVASAPDMSDYYQYLQMPEVNDGSFSHTILAISNGGEVRIGYGLVSATPTWATVYTSKNIGTNAAALQAAVASLNAPMVGTAAQRNAFVPVSGTTPYWYVTDENDPSDGQPGRMYQWYSGTWNATGQQPIVAGRITAGLISAGAIGAQALAASIIMANHELRSTAYVTGTSTTPGTGFKIVGGTGAASPFTVTYMDGTTDTVIAEFGGNVKLGGLKAAVIANRVKGNVFTRNGTGTTDVDIPEGVVSIEVTLQAAGGNGYSMRGQGGSGGQYRKLMVTVKPHNKYRITIGAVGSNSTFSWVSFDGTSGFSSDSGFTTITSVCGTDGTAGGYSSAPGTDCPYPYEHPENGWNLVGGTGGDSAPAGGGVSGAGGRVGAQAGGQGTAHPSVDIGGGGGASAMAGGGTGQSTLAGGAGVLGSGGGSGNGGGAGGPGYGRAKW